MTKRTAEQTLRDELEVATRAHVRAMQRADAAAETAEEARLDALYTQGLVDQALARRLAVQEAIIALTGERPETTLPGVEP